jgi:hypothetical protein
MRCAEDVQHALSGEVASDLLPHDVPQIELRNVQSDAERGGKLHHVQPVGDHQHAVDRHLDRDDVVDVSAAATPVEQGRHG